LLKGKEAHQFDMQHMQHVMQGSMEHKVIPNPHQHTQMDIS